MHAGKPPISVLFKSILVVIATFMLTSCAQTTSSVSLSTQTASPDLHSTVEMTPGNTSLPVSNAKPAALPTSPAAFTDPFDYCAAVETVDTPDLRYSGPKMPDSVAKSLQKASGASADAPLELFVNNSFWRCLNGKVYACFVGANLPCTEKANIDKTLTSAETDFCKTNQNSDFIPAVVTGHDTVYSWGCKDSAPVILKQEFQVDSRGFISNFWYPIAGQ
jgi:hypothetical protein